MRSALIPRSWPVATIVVLAAGSARSQELVFPTEPFWASSPSRLTRGVAVGDLNRDGFLDLAFANQGEESAVYLNQGGTPRIVPLGGLTVRDAQAVALGDLDADGDLDLVFGTRGRLELHRNDGGGRSVLDWWSDDDWNTRDIAVADLDADGDLDLVCANYGFRDTVFRNDDGRLMRTPVWDPDSTQTSLCVAVGYVDPDSYPDLVFGTESGFTLHLSSDGTPGPPVRTPTPAPVRDVALGDIDGDGNLDLVCGLDRGPNTWYANEGIRFSAKPTGCFGDTADSTVGVALGDLDGDGDLDVFVANHDSPSGVHRNDGGTIATDPAWTYLAKDASCGVLADVDGDNRLDPVLGVDDRSNLCFRNGTPSLRKRVWATAEERTNALALGDIDGDGDLDLVCGNQWDPTRLYRNDGTPEVFADAAMWSDAPRQQITLAVALGDVDGDGFLDLVCGNGKTGGTMDVPNVMYCWDPDAKTFGTKPCWTSPDTSQTTSVALVDLDGDTDLDLVCGNESAPNTVYRNEGGQLIDWSWLPDDTLNTWSLAVGDVDDDGDPDVVFGNLGRPSRLYLTENGSLSTENHWTPPPESYPTRATALGDVDGDGDLDLLCANDMRENTLFENVGGRFTDHPVWLSGSDARSVAAALVDVDGDGDLDALFGNEDEPSTMFLNEGGVLSSIARPLPLLVASVKALVAADLDGDGDEDLVAGAYLAANRLLISTRSPVGEAPLPNGAAFLRGLRFEAVDAARARVEFRVVDREGDPVHVAASYRFRGDPRWRPITAIDGDGPFASSPSGSIGSFEWDLLSFPESERSVVLGLRAVENPGVVSAIQRIPLYGAAVGALRPERPRLELSAETLDFGTLSQGDSCARTLSLHNTGTRLLTVSNVHPTAPEVLVDVTEAELAPGEILDVKVTAAPVDSADLSGPLEIVSDDPLNPVRAVDIVVHVLEFGFSTSPIVSDDPLPWGAPLPIFVSPDPGAIEGGRLVYRRADGGDTTGVDLEPLGASGDFLGVIPDTMMTDRGVQYFVEAWNGPVHGRMPTAGWDSVKTGPPPDVLVGLSPAVANNEVTVIATVARVTSGSVHYRKGGEGEGDYEKTDFAVGTDPGVAPRATIPAAAVTPRGLEYWIELTVSGDTLREPRADWKTHPRTLRTEVRRFEEAERHAGGVYRMVSVPLDFDSDFSLRNILDGQSDFGEYGLMYRAFRYYPDSVNVEIPLDNSDPDFDALRPGRGYWLISRDDNRIDTFPLPGHSTPTDRAYEIPLEPGWNQIGNPFAFPVAWGSVEHSGDVGDPVAFDPELNAYSPDTVRTLEPFRGYFVQASASDTLRVPPMEAPSDPAAAVRPAVVAEWELTIRAESVGGGSATAILGVHEEARDGHDALDRADPPPAPDGRARLAVENRTWPVWPGLYRRDFRSPAEGHAWDLVVLTGEPREITVCLEPHEPAPAAALLVDRETGARRDLSASACVFPILAFGSRRPYRLTVVAGSESFVTAEGMRRTTFPSALELGPAAPNPLRAATRIRFGLPRAQRASLDVFDVSGRRTASLIPAGMLPAGYHAVIWNGTDVRGRRAASGVYVYRLVTEDGTRTRKMVLLR